MVLATNNHLTLNEVDFFESLSTNTSAATADKKCLKNSDALISLEISENNLVQYNGDNNNDTSLIQYNGDNMLISIDNNNSVHDITESNNTCVDDILTAFDGGQDHHQTPLECRHQDADDVIQLRKENDVEVTPNLLDFNDDNNESVKAPDKVLLDLHQDGDTDQDVSNLEKSSSLSHLDRFVKTSKDLFNRGQRAISFHEDSTKDRGTFVTFQNKSNTSYDDVNEVSISMDELEKRSNHVASPLRNLNRNFANEMYRKTVSLCELQNEKLRKNIEKIEKKFISSDALINDEETEDWFPRLSYEDCSSCASCRSLSSSYHSLLYDMDTAVNYQIYQPTVCDVVDTHCVSTTSQTHEDDNNTETVDGELNDDQETKKMDALKHKTSKFFKQGQNTLGNFKDRFRKKTK